MSFEKEDYEFKKEYEKTVITDIEKIGVLLDQIDVIAKDLRFYALQVGGFDNGKNLILNPFTNFLKLGDDYEKWRDYTIYSILPGGPIAIFTGNVLLKNISKRKK